MFTTFCEMRTSDWKDVIQSTAPYVTIKYKECNHDSTQWLIIQTYI